MGILVVFMAQLAGIAQAICWVFGIYILIKLYVALDIYIKKNRG